MGNRQSDGSWDTFRYFLAVARCGTLSGAAVQIGTEHTTVARHVRLLEQELKTTLFHKSNHGYELTEAGQHLLSAVETMESTVLSARAAATGTQQISGTVRVGAPDGFGTVFLAPRLGALRRRFPTLKVEILALPRLFSLSKREADIAIGLSGSAQMRVASRRLTNYRLFVYGSRKYLETAPPLDSIDDLKHHPIIGYVEELVFTPEVDYLGAIGSEIDAPIRSTSLVTQIHAVLGGAGLCILPAFVGSSYPNLAAVLTDKISLTRAFHMHIHEDHRKAAHVRAVASFIESEVEKNAALFLSPQPQPGSLIWNLPDSG
jgi:DNA-binding transcriptional LysR family regulator